MKQHIIDLRTGSKAEWETESVWKVWAVAIVEGVLFVAATLSLIVLFLAFSQV